jgi:flagellar protein FliO/FliZ
LQVRLPCEEPTVFMDLLRALFALALTLGLFWLGVWGVRRWGPKGLLQLQVGADRRLAVVESLSLDATRRLVLVRCDGHERLLLLGEGRELTPPPQKTES